MDVMNRAQNWVAQKMYDFMVARGKSWSKLWLIAQEWKLFGNQVTNPFKQLSTIYMAIKLIGDNAGQLKLKFYRKDDPEKEVENPALRKLFDNPNPLMSFGELMEATVIFFKIHGESFWKYEKSMGQVAGTGFNLPAEIWPFKPTYFKEMITQDGRMIAGWKLQTRYISEVLDIEDVMHVRDFDPDDDFRGFSPLAPLQKTIDIDWSALCYNKAFFENDATPGFMLGTDKDINETQRKRLKEWWEKEYKGASKAHKLAILEGGLKPLQTGIDQQKMQFLEQRKYNREEMLGIFRVPKAMFAITDDLNYATFIGQKKIFWTDTIIPLIKRIEEEINAQFFARFAPDLVCRFDFSNILALQEELKEKLEAAERLQRLGYPVNQINKRLQLGFDDVAWGNVWWAPINLVPISGPESPLATPLTTDPLPSDTPKALVTEIEVRFEKLFIVKQTRLETQMESKVKRYFFEQRKRVFDNLTNTDKAIKGPIRLNINWGKETDIFAALMGPFLSEGIQQGALTAKDLIGGDVNEDVLRGRLVSYLAIRTESTRAIVQRWGEEIVSVVADGITLGQTIDEISSTIRDKYNVIGSKAKMIARTESTGALNGGSLQYYDLAGVKRKKWVTAGDEHVRDSHKRVNGETVDINKKFSNGLDFPGGEGPAEEVINCFLPDTIVQGDFLAGIKSNYSGPIVNIITRSGQRLSVTPNHPILTDQGLIPAEFIRKKDNLVGYCSKVNPKLVSPEINQQHKPSRIEDVFNAMRIGGSSSRRHLTSNNLHGDSKFTVGEVDVVRTDRELSKEHDAFFLKKEEDIIFKKKSMGEALISGFGGLNEFVPASFSSTASLPGGTALADYEGPVGFDVLPFKPLRFGAPPEFNPEFLKFAHEGNPYEPGFVRNLFKRFPSLVLLDQVINIMKEDFWGHVYDLQSVSGLMIAQNIITSNCRCTFIGKAI